jgi:cell pole-organizing protein PopZ
MASNPQHEPTMEEILASIRKIISEDSTEAAPPAAAPVAAAPVPKAVEPEEPEVLELTQEVEEEPAPAPVQTPEPVMVAKPEPVKPAEDVVFQTVEEPVVSSTPAQAPSTEGIFSDKTRKAIDDAFANLDTPEETPAPAKPAAFAPTPHAALDGDSVEAVFERAVRDAVGPHIDQWMAGQKDELLASMKPLIRDWMDEHFPALLEGAVRDEVARAVKARGKR